MTFYVFLSCLTRFLEHWSQVMEVSADSAQWADGSTGLVSGHGLRSVAQRHVSISVLTNTFSLLPTGSGDVFQTFAATGV